MRIGILGTRGIPNHYGGFEQWAEHLSKGLVERGCEVYVYNSHNHPYKEKTWEGVNIVHCYDPEHKIGTAGQFIYDLNCIIDCRKRKLDIILQLGYTSSSVWGWLLPRKNTLVFTNMDGFEWKRSKYGKSTKGFLKKAEKLAVRFSDRLIADAPLIKGYFNENYDKPVHYIPYGTQIFTKADISKIQVYGLKPYGFNLLIARLEPENNIETIIRGTLQSKTLRPLLIVGDYSVPYGQGLFAKYYSENRIKFLGGIYDIGVLGNLRFFSNIYFHGHSVGGTNPSLLEAMASSARICAHDNPFNRGGLGNEGLFFKGPEDITGLIDKDESKEDSKGYLERNRQKVKDNFLLEDVIGQYYNLFKIKGTSS